MNQQINQQKSWPFEQAYRLFEKIKAKAPKKGYVLFETGYGPSGLPHIGTFGEVLRTTMVRRAFETFCDIPTKLYSFSDDMDGLRKVPTNLPNQELLKKNLYKSLTTVPDPFGCHESMGHHNNEQLVSFLKAYDFDFTFQSSTHWYKSGKFDEPLKKVFDHYDEILKLMLGSLREERQQTYSPFLPICPKTGHVLQVPIIELKRDSYTVIYKDPQSGALQEVPITGGNCKLQWKVDWAMRWYAFEVDFEMSGKDLIPSVELASKICKILGKEPPVTLTVELFLDHEGKKISKSKGNGLSMEEWLMYAPKESLAYYLFLTPKRAKRLYFDMIPKSVDDYLDHLRKYPTQDVITQKDNPCFHIHGENPPPVQMSLSFSLLLNLASICNTLDPKVLWGFIERYEKRTIHDPFWDRLVDHAICYYRDFVKPHKKYHVLNQKEKTILLELKDVLLTLLEASDQEIQQNLYELGKKHFSDLKEWFAFLYKTLLGQNEGPRMGSFIALYTPLKTIELIEKLCQT